MKIAVLNDTHCGIRNSSEVFLDNAEKFYNEVFFPECEKQDIKQILHLGDYYDHRKFVNFKALNHNRRVFLDQLRKRGMSMDIIPGNHDTYYKNTNELNSLKECLGHYMNEVNIVMEPKVMKYGSLNVGLVPWICNDNYEQCMNFIRDCKADWIGAHLELKGFEMMRGLTNTHGMSPDIFKRFELVLTGHYHVGSKKDNIWYLGSQMEFFWSDAHDPKFFHIIDTETRQIEKIRNNNTLFEKVVYNDEEIDYNSYNKDLSKKFVKVVVANKTDPFTFDRFIDNIQNQDIYELKIAENFNEFVGANVDDEDMNFEDTTEIVDTYIDAVDTDLDKDKIKVQMRELMTEAQTLEIA
jgi:DNA repair exonuclease SbcCD nuclease subunit|tara:strand:- start:3667 stop:4725 length:1059 start_codon:yes stop_codon:yes gene_type:complete